MMIVLRELRLWTKSKPCFDFSRKKKEAEDEEEADKKRSLIREEFPFRLRIINLKTGDYTI